jgi:DNA-binding phage protein
MATIGEVLRRAIAARKETRYRTSKSSGVTHRTLDRFLDEQADVRLSTVQALADYLNLELKAKG